MNDNEKANKSSGRENHSFSHVFSWKNQSMLDRRVITSGAYVFYKGFFVFQVGPTKSCDRLGVVRLGGHLENNETAIEAAQREVFEESSLLINPIESSVTFMIKEGIKEPFDIKVHDEFAPVLIIERPDKLYSVMYLSYAKNKPVPASETNGLLLLTPNQIHQICNNNITLQNYLDEGGLVILKTNLNKELVLEPFPQLRFLSYLLTHEAKLMKEFMSS